MLEIKNLHVKLEDEDKAILKGLTLTVPKGEVHAILGHNGSGKSTLAYALMGSPRYEVTAGEVEFKGEDLLVREDDNGNIRSVDFSYRTEVPVYGPLSLLITYSGTQH